MYGKYRKSEVAGKVPPEKLEEVQARAGSRSVVTGRRKKGNAAARNPRKPVLVSSTKKNKTMFMFVSRRKEPKGGSEK